MKKIKAVPMPLLSNEFPMKLFLLRGYIRKGRSLQIGDSKMEALKSFSLGGMSVDTRDNFLMLKIRYRNDKGKEDGIMAPLAQLEQMGIIHLLKT